MIYKEISIILLTIIFFIFILTIITFLNIDMNYGNTFNKLNKKITYEYNY